MADQIQAQPQSSTPWIVGGAVGFLALMYYLREQATVPVAPPPTTGGSTCDALEAVNPTAALACKAGGYLTDLLGQAADAIFTTDADYMKKDAANRQANGAVDVVVDDFLSKIAMGVGDTGTGVVSYLHKGIAARFTNGCVPFTEAPGWAACAPGTQDMALNRIPIGLPAGPAGHRSGELPHTSLKWLMTGVNNGDQIDIATTGDFPAGGKYNGTPFPLPIPPSGVGYYFKGKPYVCPAGTASTVVALRDHTGAAPQPGCVPSTATDIPTQAGGDHTSSTGVVNQPGYSWVPDATGGHWERTRAGQPDVPKPLNGLGDPITIATLTPTPWYKTPWILALIGLGSIGAYKLLSSHSRA